MRQAFRSETLNRGAHFAFQIVQDLPTVFELLGESGNIPLHLSFRPAEKRVAINARQDSDWGTEQSISFGDWCTPGDVVILSLQRQNEVLEVSLDGVLAARMTVRPIENAVEVVCYQDFLTLPHLPREDWERLAIRADVLDDRITASESLRLFLASDIHPADVNVFTFASPLLTLTRNLPLALKAVALLLDRTESISTATEHRRDLEREQIQLFIQFLRTKERWRHDVSNLIPSLLKSVASRSRAGLLTCEECADLSWIAEKHCSADQAVRIWTSVMHQALRDRQFGKLLFQRLSSHGSRVMKADRHRAAFLAEGGAIASALPSVVARARKSSHPGTWITLSFLQAQAGIISESLENSRFHGFKPVREVAPPIAWPRRGRQFWPHFQLPAPSDLSLNEALPRITVVIPNLNYGPYLEEAILSVLNQNYPTLEIIVVDGGSSDESSAIIERYRAQLSMVIREKDRGQSHAINKGFNQSSGELLTWLNSDDMLAPGALWFWALEYLSCGSDLIVGSCLAHRDYVFEELRGYAKMEEVFSPSGLAELRHNWLAGRFPFQPEVIFSRELWERAGGNISEERDLAMDYDLWLRFADLRPSVRVIPQATALFRYHNNNKTRDLSPAILEQAAVRESRGATPKPSSSKIERLRAKLRAFFKSENRKVTIMTSRFEKIFSPGLVEETRAYLSNHGFRASLVERIDPTQITPGELIIVLVNMQPSEWEVLPELRQRFPANPMVGWFWDNHHQIPENLELATHFDAVLCCHDAFASALESTDYVVLPSIPACVTQWTRTEAEDYFRRHGNNERHDELFGGYIYYSKTVRRNKLIALAQESLPHHALNFLDEDDPAAYFGLSREARFELWSKYKSSLVAPVFHDLSQRFFDTLLTGQMPIVPRDIGDAFKLESYGLPLNHHFTILEKDDPESLRLAVAQATKHFEKSCPSARHRHCLSEHMFVHRTDTLIHLLQTVSQGTDSLPSPGTGYFSQRLPRRKLIVDLKYGLGNRLRALASAYVVAQVTGRELIPIWHRDQHLDCSFDSLFENDLGVLQDGSSELHDTDVQLDYTRLSDETIAESPFVEDLTVPRLAILTQRILKTRHNYWDRECAFLRTLKPNQRILDRVDAFQNLEECIGLHIRARPAEFSNEYFDGAEAQINYWRQQSGVATFDREISRLRKENPNQKFFLASDSAEVYSHYKAELGDHLIHLRRSSFDRSSEQILEALADALCLSRCKILFGSNWSSFTELASRFGGVEVRLAGVHF